MNHSNKYITFLYNFCITLQICSDFAKKYINYAQKENVEDFPNGLSTRWPSISTKIVNLAKKDCNLKKCIPANNDANFEIANYMDINDIFSKNVDSGSTGQINCIDINKLLFVFDKI